jgi:NAD(P)-dependent dehydrogenase (short-subunit alcohol dehydrogenase family)
LADWIIRQQYLGIPASTIIDTPQNRQAMPQSDSNLWVTPEELARVILFLASKDASPIHGALIPVFGKI